MPLALLFDGPGLPLRSMQFPLRKPVGAEVLVGVECCTVCKSDLHSWQGKRPSPAPCILGHEIVGRILAFGPEASRRDARGSLAKVGDRITWCVAACCGSCFFCQHELTQKCHFLKKYGHERCEEDTPYRGGLAEHVLLWPGTGWLVLSEHIPLEIAAMVNCSLATATACLRAAGRLEGACIVIFGAGILGLMAAVQAREAGAETIIVTDPIAQQRERAIFFGATDVVETNPQSLLKTVHQATSQRGADIVLELAGVFSAVEQGLELLRIGGTMILAGTVSPVPAISLLPETVVRRMLTLRGVHNYQTKDLIEAVRFLESNLTQYPWDQLIGKRFTLEDADEALVWARDHPGQRAAVLPGWEQRS